MAESWVISRIALAALLGSIVGFEREFRGHAAGLRTHALVCIGSSLIMVVNILLFEKYHGSTPIDVTRMAAQVVSGIGFLGAGTIIRYGASVKGLTTAASLWVVGAIGLAAGAGLWVSAVISTGFVIMGLTVFRAVSKFISNKRANKTQSELNEE